MYEWIPIVGGIILLLWLFLGVAVGIHAQEHNRSGILWFLAIMITGIFGFMFYMLAITPTNTDEPIDAQSINHKIVTKGPVLIVSGIVGGICGLLVGAIFAEGLVSSTTIETTVNSVTYYDSPYDSMTVPVLLLSFILGGSVFARGNYINGFRRVFYYLSYIPAGIIGILAGLALLEQSSFLTGGFLKGLFWLLPPLFPLGGSIIIALLWNRVYHGFIEGNIQGEYLTRFQRNES